LLAAPRVVASEVTDGPHETPTTLVGTWTGSTQDVRFIFEFAENGDAALTEIATNSEPTFFDGRFEPAMDNEPGVVVTLAANDRSVSVRCTVKDETILECRFDDSFSVTCTRNTDFDWELWGTYYYLRPRPERFVQAVTAMSQQGVLDREFGDIADVAILLSQILERNPSQIRGWLGEIDRTGRESLWEYILWYSRSKEAADILMEKSGNTGGRWSRHYESGAPVVYRMDPDQPNVLDMNWGCFMATGSREPVRNIIRAFNHVRYEEAIDGWERSRKTTRDRERLLKGMAFRAARWSVQANCTQHSRVLAYCDELLESGDLNAVERSTLKSILDAADIQLARARLKTRGVGE